MVSGLHHIVLFFRDTERAKAWYLDAGFEYARGYDGMHWLSIGGSEIMLHPADRSSGGSGLVIHFATPDVQALFEKVVQAGIQPFDHQQPGQRILAPITRPWGAQEFELQDPEGHNLAFTQV